MSILNNFYCLTAVCWLRLMQLSKNKKSIRICFTLHLGSFQPHGGPTFVQVHKRVYHERSGLCLLIRTELLLVPCSTTQAGLWSRSPEQVEEGHPALAKGKDRLPPVGDRALEGLAA